MELKLPYSGSCELTSRFGWRHLNGENDYHSGIDLVGQEDKTIVSPCAGVVGRSTILYKEADPTNTWQWGNYIRIDCDDGMQVYLCHMAKRYAVEGQRVNVGDPLGVEGNTGYSFGQHCHFEVRVNGAAVDPTPMLGIPNEWGYYRNEPETMEPMPTVSEPAALDNTPDGYAVEAVSWALNNHILLGTPNGNLKLHEPVTRQDLLVILYRAR